MTFTVALNFRKTDEPGQGEQLENDPAAVAWEAVFIYEVGRIQGRTKPSFSRTRRAQQALLRSVWG